MKITCVTPSSPSHTEVTDPIFSVASRRNEGDRESNEGDPLRWSVQYSCEFVGKFPHIYSSLVPEDGCRSFFDSGDPLS